jgi:tripartite-type tricarboxylate transporter receptor subunit TctC
MPKILAWCAVAAACSFLFTGALHAQAYPAKPVRIVVPFAPGGGTDVIARHLAMGLSESMKRQFIVENRAGANAIVGTEFVARAPADGYTLIFVSSPHSVNPGMYAKLPYDTLRDFAPIAQVASSPYFLVTHPSLPARNVRELVALARKQPDQILYGSGGSGSSAHLSAELFNQLAGVKLREVPFKGAGPALIGTLTGEVALVFGNALTVKPHIETGRLRALGIASAERSKSFPDLPTIAGLPIGRRAGPARAGAHAAGHHRHAQHRIAQGDAPAGKRRRHAPHGGGHRADLAGGIRKTDRVRDVALEQGHPDAQSQAAVALASSSTLRSISRASSLRARGARPCSFAIHGS